MAREFAKQFYNSKEWQMTRAYILKRDNYLCVKCGQPAEEVHHIIHLSPKNIGDVSITMNETNLMSLCKNCHFAEHWKDKAEGHKKKYDPLPKIDFDEFGNVVMSPQLNKVPMGVETVAVDLFNSECPILKS